MPRIRQPISAEETLKIISKSWLTTEEISRIACCNKNRAGDIRKEIEAEIMEQEKKRLPYGLTPTDKVVKYLGINVTYLKKICS